MDAPLQTLLAFALVALAAGYLLRTWFGSAKKKSGCAGGQCGAPSPEVRDLQRRLRQG